MFAVFQGFAVILAVIGLGYLASRLGVVRGEQRFTLNNVAFYVATPALLFDLLHDAEPGVLFSPVILVSCLVVVLVVLLYVVVSRLFFTQDLGDVTLGAAAASYVNANGLGLPVAVYIVGDATYVPPMLFVQLVVFVPVLLTILEVVKGPGRGAAGVLPSLGHAAMNPIIIASVAGFLFALFNIPLPGIVHEPISMVGAAAIPMTLLSFGVSLHGQRVLRNRNDRLPVLVVSAFKLLVMPLIAWGLSLVFGLGPHETFVTVMIAALPSAQNVYVFAASYQRAEIMVRDAVFLTTFLSLPVIAIVALTLSA